MAPITSHHLLPPFAEDIKTAPLVSISFAKLESGDQMSSEAFFAACKELGCFYLDMFGSALGEQILVEAEQLNTFQQKFFKMPHEVKDQYGRPHLHPFYAYRYNDLDILGEDGMPLRTESYNLRKDDILGQCERLACPPSVLANQTLFENYTLHCRAAIDCLLEHLNTHLQLPTGTLANLHRIHERSGDHVRLIQAPPSPFNESRAQRAEHTDFGSITVLFDWLGGLQIRLPDTTKEWVYVRPISGSAVINLGDAIVKLTAGLLRSNIHRVVPPVGEQAGAKRNALVFFSRPEDFVVLRRLRGGSIDAQPVVESGEVEMTAHEWIMAKGTGQLPEVYTKSGFEWKANDERLKIAPVPVAVEA